MQNSLWRKGLAIIVSAVLNLYFYDWDSDLPFGRDLNLYRITSDWDDASGDTSYEFTSDSKQCYLAFRGGSDDLVNNGANTNTFLDLEKGELIIKSVVETG